MPFLLASKPKAKERFTDPDYLLESEDMFRWVSKASRTFNEPPPSSGKSLWRTCRWLRTL